MPRDIRPRNGGLHRLPASPYPPTLPPGRLASATSAKLPSPANPSFPPCQAGGRKPPSLTISKVIRVAPEIRMGVDCKRRPAKSGPLAHIATARRATRAPQPLPPAPRPSPCAMSCQCVHSPAGKCSGLPSNRWAPLARARPRVRWCLSLSLAASVLSPPPWK